MIILVVNLGSTSFKCRLYDMSDDGCHETLLAIGTAERIGQLSGKWSVEAADRKADGMADLSDHAAAIELLLNQVIRLDAVASLSDVEAIGFKAVHGGPISGAVKVDDHVLATMEQFADVAPQHNPPYIEAMKAFAAKLPGVPQVAAFETGYHQQIPLARQVYGVPYEWIDQLGVRRYGFHGASHRYIATRMAQIAPDCVKLISCHLGGSCSISGICDGQSVANSFGMTAQSGVFHSSRVGDFDVFALMKLLESGMSLDVIWQKLGKEGGLKGLSGIGPDMREVEQAAANGDEQAKLAVDAFVESCRHYIGAFLAVLNGVDALVFTGGIGQHSSTIRAAVCAELDFAGICLDETRNRTVSGSAESRIDAGSVAIWVVPTNEEIIIARQTVEVLSRQPA